MKNKTSFLSIALGALLCMQGVVTQSLKQDEPGHINELWQAVENPCLILHIDPVFVSITDTCNDSHDMVFRVSYVGKHFTYAKRFGVCIQLFKSHPDTLVNTRTDPMTKYIPVHQ